MNNDEKLSMQLAENLSTIDYAIRRLIDFLDNHNLDLFADGKNSDLPEQLIEIKSQFETLHYKAILYPIVVNFTNISQTALQTQSNAISKRIEKLAADLRK